MGEPKGKVKPPNLPDGAPQELKDFVACKRLTVEIDLATLGWLPTPPGVPKELAPSVTAEPGATPNTATVSVGWGFVSISLPVSVGSDGQLNVDTGNLPDIENLKTNIDNWVKKFNDSLKGNGKRLSGFTINGTKITLTKAAIAATTPQTPAPPPPPTTPPGETTPADGKSAPGKGCLLGVLGLAFAGALGVGAFFLAKDDDDNKTSAPPVSDQPAAATTSSTSSTSSTTTTTTTTAPASQLQDCGNLEFGVNWSTVGEDQGCTWMGPIVPCDPARLPCATNVTFPFVVVDPRTIILHDGGPVDPLTGLQGPSSAGHLVFIGSGPDGVLTFSSMCGGQLITGQTPYSPGQTGIVSHSLFNFGPCTANSLQFDGGGTMIDLFPALADPAFTVGPNEVPPESFEPAGWRSLSEDSRWGDYSATVLNTLSDSTLDCVAAQIERMPYRSIGCGSAPRMWTYRAVLPEEAGGAGPMLAIGAGYANALGSMTPTAADYNQFSTMPVWTANGLFPCGQGPLGMAICPEGAPPRAEAGGYLAVTIVTDTTTGRQFTIDVGDGRSPIIIDPAGNTFETSGDTSPIVVVTDRAIHALLPDALLPPDSNVTVSLATGEGTFGYAPIPIDNVLTLPSLLRDGTSATTSTTTTVAATAEPADEFLRQLSESLSTGDGSFAVSRLHPKVIEIFGEAACNQTVPAPDDQTFNVQLVSEGARGPWDWPQPDGTTVRIDDAVTFEVQITQQGATSPSQVHLALVDGTWRWFTYCVP